MGIFSYKASYTKIFTVIGKHFKYISEHPDGIKWLKDHLEPRFWQKIERMGFRN